MMNGDLPDAGHVPSTPGIVTVILVCSSVLERVSLQTAINAIAGTKVIARSANTESALQLVEHYMPDILLADAYSLHDELRPLLRRAEVARPSMLRVVLLAGAMHQQFDWSPYANFVMYQSELPRRFEEVVLTVRNRPKDDQPDL